jgi:topoisomerase-4 subunit A
MSAEAMIEREPLTIIASTKNWLRAMKGHADLAALEGLKFKEGDALATAFHTETTDRILLFASGGRVFTLAANDLPGARGFGEPLSLMIDFPTGDLVVTLAPWRADGQWLMVASDGRGFVAKADDLLAETRKGRQLLTARQGAVLMIAKPIPAGHDHVAVIGENRKMLVFPLAQLPVMARGQGVALQKYKDGSVADATTLAVADGLSWKMQGDSARTRTESDLTPWLGARAGAGRLPPQGFPKDNRFP